MKTKRAPLGNDEAETQISRQPWRFQAVIPE
jgi:hypothetical protein